MSLDSRSIAYGARCLHDAFQYADDVRSEKIITCKYVKLAVERWFDDLENAGARGWEFDSNKAIRQFAFTYQYCKHYAGNQWAGMPIELSPWQSFINANVFGWVSKETGFRRFRNVYEEVARKNGKTTKIASVGTYMACYDNEAGAKVYCAATKRDQAKEVFDSIKKIIKNHRVLKRFCKPLTSHIECETKNSPDSRVELLSKDYDSMDGFNVHAALVDELHAHRDSGMWDVLESARGARTQPIIWGITTAGKNQDSFCYELRGYAVKILEGVIPVERADRFFTIIYTLDEHDDWSDPVNWIKANPNLDISVSLDDLISQSHKAKEMPTARIEFQTKRLNMWVYGESTWMNMEKWNSCIDKNFDERAAWNEDEYSELEGETCYGGIDLASVEDLTALTFTFPNINGKTTVISRGYLPQYAFEKRVKKGGILRSMYQRFVDDGSLVLTPGETCDYDFIESDVIKCCSRFNVKEIAFDRYNSSQLVNNLIGEGVPMVEMGQGYGSINAPMKALLQKVLSGQLRHNSALLNFAVSNVVAVQNSAGDIKFDKSKVSEKIDPAAAMIMAIGRQLTLEYDQSAAVDDFLNELI